jgi:hypothetical protein
VQEIVYLSATKLKDIIPTSRPWWRRLRAKNVSAEVAAGPVKVGADIKLLDPDEVAALADSIDKAETLGETAKWFEDSTLTAGELMLFEGRFGCHLVEFAPSPAAVLFCQLPEPNCRSVVLHGSAANVTQWRQRELGSEYEAALVPYSDPAAVPGILHAAVATEQDSPLWGFWQRLGQGDTQAPGDALTRNLTALYRGVVAESWFRASAGYFTGFAYTSGIVPLPDGTEIVLGSPLYVKRARPEV